ncbi:mannitol/fructose-specific phosphotransferase system IIA component (Ntr-type) [Neobacillus cucumis]|nr:mannitol/fructose-specific phosphotransferase system IIA component (Ntr-type) [Neobacillus cucumis]
MPHARPEDGVNQLGMSFLKCEHPVYLMEDPKHEINIFIVLAAIDNETHL